MRLGSAERSQRQRTAGEYFWSLVEVLDPEMSIRSSLSLDVEPLSVDRLMIGAIAKAKLIENIFLNLWTTRPDNSGRLYIQI